MGRTYGTAAVSSAMVVFSINNLLVTTMTLTGLGTALYRLWLGSAALAGVLWLTGRRMDRRVLRAALPAGIAYGVHICLLFTAFQTTSLANATVIMAMQSGLTLTVVGRLFGERVGGMDLLLTGVATAGAVLVIVGGRSGGTGDLRGDALAVLGMLGVTAYFVLAKQARARVPTGEYQLGLLLVAATLTLPVFVVAGEPFVAPAGWDWTRLVVLAGVGTAGHLSLNWAHPHVPLRTSSLLTLAVPVLTTTLAWVVLDQRLSVVQFVGAAVTLGALGVVIARAVSTATPAPPVVADTVGLVEPGLPDGAAADAPAADARLPTGAGPPAAPAEAAPAAERRPGGAARMWSGLRGAVRRR